MTAIHVIIGIVVFLVLYQLIMAVYNSKTIWACPMCGASIKKAWYYLFFKILSGINHIRVVKLNCPECKQTNYFKPSIKNEGYS